MTGAPHRVAAGRVVVVLEDADRRAHPHQEDPVTYHDPDPDPHPVITSRPIRASVRAYALPLGTQTAAERAAALIRDAVLAQLEDALPGITPEESARLLKFAGHALQVSTHPDGSVSMYLAFNVAARRTA